jgi:hypothetical protein
VVSGPGSEKLALLARQLPRGSRGAARQPLPPSPSCSLTGDSLLDVSRREVARQVHRAGNRPF